MTYAAEKKSAPAIKAIVPRVTQSEFPYRVAAYQFKDLDAARQFSRDLVSIPKTPHRHHVGMFHRRVEVSTTVDGHSVVVPVLLDVTTDSPEEAESKWVAPL